jgi:hypothetical protein
LKICHLATLLLVIGRKAAGKRETPFAEKSGRNSPKVDRKLQTINKLQIQL